MRPFIALLMAALCIFSLAACGKGSAQPDESTNAIAPVQPADSKVVGISVPNDTDPRWTEETAALSQLLEKEGLATAVEYAQDDVSLQATQIQALIDRPVSCLVIAAIDSLALADVLLAAKQSGIPVIAYDRLLMQTDAVTHYVGCDYQAMGEAMANYIVHAKQLETAQAEGRSHTIEFFMGSPEDNNAVLLYTGIWQVLQPYLDCGVLVCRTGRTAFEDVCIQNWSKDLAKTLCQTYLTTHYTDTPPQILCTASDEIADGCRTALEDAGITTGEQWPVITGQGAQESAIQRLASGQQSLTVHKQLLELPAICCEAVLAALRITHEDWDDTICHNGSVSIPARYCEFTLIEP